MTRVSDWGQVWIIGSGRFGRRAVELLLPSFPAKGILVIDPKVEALNSAAELGTRVFQAEGAGFLSDHLDEAKNLEWIVPSAPVHLALEWIKLRLGADVEVVPIPRTILEEWPNPMDAPQGGFYLSHADFICPDDCPEPAAHCTVTGRKRNRNLFELLAQTPPKGFAAAVIRSRQLAPGLGGYRPTDLYEAEGLILRAGSPVILATACRCHGVAHALKQLRPSL